ncbi:S-layer homology domain-containing protein, partial [uncultured Veillonella sp.]|uniref:S-layer homology domain-containing protein n=1 Tax=uncultured Veillonella sp. TaxID=159268 RepID=UPI00261C13C3
MKKRFATMLAATAVLGVTTAFAANPFSDVTPSDWAYQSVAQLAEAGVINGYPDGTFKGQNNITRYEMAQMVAKAMANQARANAEQQALINRLANEFASELNNLGVRVSALEDKVGNVKVTGDVRLRYQGS